MSDTPTPPSGPDDVSGGTPPPPPPPPGPSAPPPGPGAPPPPPPSGFGGAGAPPPGATPGPAGGAPVSAYSPLEAVKYGWEKFTANLAPWVLAGLVLLGISALFLLLFTLVFSAFAANPATEYNPVTGEVTSSGAAIAGLSIGSILVIVIAIVLAWIVHVQFARAAFETAEQGSIKFEVFTRTALLGALIVAALIAAALTAVGLIACCIGAVVIGFFVQFYPYPLLDRSASGGWDSVKQSFSFVSNNLGPVILLTLVLLLISFVLGLGAGLIGLIVPVLGNLVQFIISLVLVPVFALAQAYTYRYLKSQPIA